MKLALGVTQAEIDLAKVKDARSVPPYARLIHDVLLGDRSLFTRPDGLEHAWEVVSRLLNRPPAIRPYAPGFWGPAGTDELAGPDG